MERRSWHRRVLLRSITHSGLYRLFRRELRGKVVILKYHHIAGPEHQGLFAFERNVPLQLFRQQMRFLKRACRVIPLEDLANPDTPMHHQNSSRPLVAITLDDGYLDNFRYAFPVLQEFGFTATFFIATAYVSTGITYPRARVKALFRHNTQGVEDRATEDLGLRRDPKEDEEQFVARVGDELFLGRPPEEINALLERWEQALGRDASRDTAIQVMDWENLETLRRAGMTIGAHTVNHRRLVDLAREEVLQELRSSREELQARLGVPITSFAFPDGRIDEVSLQAVKEEFTLACTSETGIESLPLTQPHLLRRASPSDYLPAFAALVSGLAHWWRRRRSQRDGGGR